MISTYSLEFRQNLLQEYLNYNLIAFLIYKPSLGITDTPTVAELAARKSLTMTNAAALEIALGNGYKRALAQLAQNRDTGLPAGNNASIILVDSSFTAHATGAFAQATHICYARGANLIGATPENGNNRGDTSGTLIKVEPLVNAPLAIAAGVTFIHQTSFGIEVE